MNVVEPDKIIMLYMNSTTKNNILILFELALKKSNNTSADIRYKSPTNLREPDFENILTTILSAVEKNLQNELLISR